jgi:hypothetical protein
VEGEWFLLLILELLFELAFLIMQVPFNLKSDFVTKIKLGVSVQKYRNHGTRLDGDWERYLFEGGGDTFYCSPTPPATMVLGPRPPKMPDIVHPNMVDPLHLGPSIT